MTKTLALLVFSIFFAAQSEAKNLQVIEESKDTGFGIYRMGAPTADEMKELCALGVEETMVLSGNADLFEARLKEYCPSLKVILNVTQNVRIPLTKKFLDAFDAWVQDAQTKGKKIVFRCDCGCHRTGRLAAYYQMKYQKISSEEAMKIMNMYGEWMILHPTLRNQVLALEQYIKGEACRESWFFCVH